MKKETNWLKSCCVNAMRLKSWSKELQPKVPEIINALKAKLQARLAEALTDELSNKSSLTAEEVNDRIRMEVTLLQPRLMLPKKWIDC